VGGQGHGQNQLWPPMNGDGPVRQPHASGRPVGECGLHMGPIRSCSGVSNENQMPVADTRGDTVSWGGVGPEGSLAPPFREIPRLSASGVRFYI